MVIESKLVFTVVDNFFGGTGKDEAKVTGRDFSFIEIRMIKNVVLAALEDIEKAWKPVHPVTTTYVRSEVNPQFAAIVPPGDLVLVLNFDIELETTTGTLTICLPFASIEPVLPKLKAQFQSEELEVDQVWVNRLRAELLLTEVETVAQLGTAEVTPSELLNFKVGDTLMLKEDADSPVVLKIEGIPKLRGFPGTSKGNKAVQISEIIEREK